MTVSDMQALIGKTGRVWVEEGQLEVRVKVKDVKKAYGRILYLITPVEGKGTKWVNSERVHLG